MEETLPAVALLKNLVLALLLVAVLLVPVLLLVPMMTLLVLLPVLLLVGALAAAGVAAPTRARCRRVAPPAAEAATAAALDLPQAGEIHQAVASCSSAATSSDQDVCQQLNVMRLEDQDVPKVKAGPPRLHAWSMNVG